MSLATKIDNQLKGSWRLYKLGVINLKYIKDDNKKEAKEKGFNFSFQEFPFYDGKALLIGNNGAGKTTLLQVFFPFIFDSSKYQRRIDPGGDRQISEWVTGNSYIYVVFKKQGEYITLGIGLNSSKGSNRLDRWQFIIESNKEILNRDSMLLKKEDGKLRPLTKAECKKKLRNFEEPNIKIRVFKSTENQQDYMKRVNDLLFGFESVSEFKDFLEFYIKLKRSLTNIENATLDNLIKTSLPNQIDTEPAVDYLKKRKRQKEKLKVAIKENELFEELKDSYSLYNKKKVYTVSEEYENIANKLKNVQNQKKAAENNLEETATKLKTTKEEIENVTQTIKNLEKQIREIERGTDDWESKIDNIKERLQEYNFDRKRKKSKKDNKKSDCEEIEKKIANLKQNIDRLEEELNNTINQLDDLAINFTFHQADIKPFLEGKFFDLDETLFKNKQQELLNKIDKIKNKLTSLNEVYRDLLNKKDRKEELKEDIRTKEKTVTELKFEIEQLKEEILNITTNNSLDKNLTQFIKENIDNSYLLNEKLILTEDRLKQDKKDAKNQSRELYEEIKKIQQEIKSGKFEVPLLEHIEEFKTKLESKDIPYQLLYKVIDFKEIPSAKKQIIEGQLKDLGLLEAFLIPIEYKNKVINLDGQAKYIFIENKSITPVSEVDKIINYLKPVENDTFTNDNIVNNILENIVADKILDTKGFALKDNLYKVDFLNGTSQRKEIKYIGIKNRRKAKERKIANLEEKAIEIEKEVIEPINLKLEFIDRIKNKVEKLNEKYNIKDNQLSFITELEDKKARVVNEINSLESKLDKEVKSYNQVRIDDLDQLDNLIDKIIIYKSKFEAVGKDYDTYNARMASLNNQKEALNDKKEEINELEEEIKELTKKITSYQSEFKFYEEQLNSQEYQEKMNRLNSKREEKKEKKNQKTKLNRRFGNLNEHKETLEEKINNLEDKFKKIKSEYRNKKNKAKSELKSEYLKYILDEDYNKFSSKEFEEKIKFIVQEFNNINKSLDGLKEKLKSNVKNTSDRMPNYTFRMDELIGKLFGIDNSERGKEYNFYKLYFKFKDRYADIKRASENVKNEFFDTFICSLTQDFISSYEKGLEVINGIKEILNNLQLSSGVKYKLKEKLIDNEKYDKEIFKTIKAQKNKGFFIKTEDGKFKPQTSYMDNKAFNRLKYYIKNRLHDFEERNKQLQNKRSYEEFAEEILDYRQWLRFELRTVQGNSTDGKSGSEKIIGKLIGLATALKAKLKAGREDNLKFLFLDEAFGKLDEGNEYVLFEFLNKIGLDFLLIGPKEINDLAYQQIDKLSYITINKDSETQEVIVLNPEFWNKRTGNYEKQTDFAKLSDRINDEDIEDIEQDYQIQDKTIEMNFGDSNG